MTRLEEAKKILDHNEFLADLQNLRFFGVAVW